MNIIPTALEGVFEIQFKPIEDDRGIFKRLFCEETLSNVLRGKKIVQSNYSLNKQAGTIRGMHAQKPPFAECKLIACLEGKADDVVVDLRKGSRTFLKHIRLALSGKNNRGVFIPEGCAHGFQALEDNTVLLYYHTATYHKESEFCVRHDDPLLSITWTLPKKNISDKDFSYPFLTNEFQGIEL